MNFPAALFQHRSIGRFYAVGVVNTFVGVGVFPLLYWTLGSRVDINLLLIASYVICTLSAFALHRSVTFESRGPAGIEARRFLVVTGIIFIANFLLLNVLLAATDFHPVILQTIIAVALQAASYVLMSRFVFVPMAATAEAVVRNSSFLDIGRHCPNCGAASGFVPAVVADPPAETMAPAAIAERWRGFFASPCFFTYCRCQSCGQLFCPAYLSEEALAGLYASMADNVHSGDPATSEQTQADYAALLTATTKRARRYLEIGPDTGVLARAIHRRLPVEAAFLVEPNRAVWPELSQAFPAGVADVRADYREFEAVIADGSLDLVVGVHVLDHLIEPQAMLAWIARKLAPGGVVGFVVHNERSLLARVLGRRWPAYCLQHPQLFNKATLAQMLREAGLRDATIVATSNRFPLSYLLSHATYALLRVRLSFGILRWPVRLRMGNIMGVATKG